MPDKRSHRGPHPEDSRLFGEAALPALREAAADYAWLLDRGYPSAATRKLVGDRYRLAQRQRVAVARCNCTRAESAARTNKCLSADEVRGQPLLVDGYNLLTTVEIALGRGVVLVARDGCYRDMASMHGTYRKVAETVPALTAIGQTLCTIGVTRTHFYLDRPVSNSGRLAAVMRRLASQHGWSWTVDLVPDPDPLLAAARDAAATADSGILDLCRAWLNLARLVIDRCVPDAWIVDFVNS